MNPTILFDEPYWSIGPVSEPAPEKDYPDVYGFVRVDSRMVPVRVLAANDGQVQVLSLSGDMFWLDGNRFASETWVSKAEFYACEFRPGHYAALCQVEKQIQRMRSESTRMRSTAFAFTEGG